MIISIKGKLFKMNRIIIMFYDLEMPREPQRYKNFCFRDAISINFHTFSFCFSFK